MKKKKGKLIQMYLHKYMPERTINWVKMSMRTISVSSVIGRHGGI